MKDINIPRVDRSLMYRNHSHEQLVDLVLGLEDSNCILYEELEELKELNKKSQLVKVPATKVTKDSCGKPVIVSDGQMLVPKDQQANLEQYTRDLQKMANMARENFALRERVKELENKHE